MEIEPNSPENATKITVNPETAPEDIAVAEEVKETPVVALPPQTAPSFDLHFTKNGVVTTVSIPNEDIHKLNPVHLYNFFHTQGIGAQISHAVEQK